MIKEMIVKNNLGIMTPNEVSEMVKMGLMKPPGTGSTGTGSTDPNRYRLAIGSGRWQGHSGHMRKRSKGGAYGKGYEKKGYAEAEKEYGSNPFASQAGYNGLVSWRV
jgi:hypothetical protein